MDTFPEELEAYDFALPSCSVPTLSNRDNVRVTAAPSHEEKQICTTLFLRSEQRRFVDVVHLEHLGIDRRWHKIREFLHNRRIMHQYFCLHRLQLITLRPSLPLCKRFRVHRWLQVRVGIFTQRQQPEPSYRQCIITLVFVVTTLGSPSRERTEYSTTE
ncbi:hypothetical protein FI667_g16983, partial [Globisporangium splendens]